MNIELFQISTLPPASLDECQWLTPQEHDRAVRMPPGSDFTQCRIQMRKILASALGVNPASLQFSLGPHGKPHCTSHPQLAFNLSHSGDLLALVWDLSTDPTSPVYLGIDVEIHRLNRQLDAIVPRFFSDSEIQQWNTLSPEHQVPGFFKGWVQKEAFIKAVGDGIAFGLDRLSVDLDPRQEARILSIEHPDWKRTLDQWEMHLLPVPDSYSGAWCRWVGNERRFG